MLRWKSKFIRMGYNFNTHRCIYFVANFRLYIGFHLCYRFICCHRIIFIVPTLATELMQLRTIAGCQFIPSWYTHKYRQIQNDKQRWQSNGLIRRGSLRLSMVFRFQTGRIIFLITFGMPDNSAKKMATATEPITMESRWMDRSIIYYPSICNTTTGTTIKLSRQLSDQLTSIFYPLCIRSYFFSVKCESCFTKFVQVVVISLTASVNMVRKFA